MEVLLKNALSSIYAKSKPFALSVLKTSFEMLIFPLVFFATSIKAQNAIVSENTKAGNPSAEWDIASPDRSIQGFATTLGVNKGETVRFKIKTDANSYSIKIYRIGYYQGNGARYVGTGSITASLPQIQPIDLYDSNTGKTDCSNWSETAHWDVPSTAVSGIYIAKLTRTDNSGSGHIVFIVRDDAGTSNILFKTSDATWQAYNNYGGTCLYANMNYGSIIPKNIPGFSHAPKVSYNRPFNNPNGGRDWFSIAEYPMIRFLEKNGYDVSYTTCVDLARSPNSITSAQHKALLSVGHDEYWSLEERNKFENARNAGVNLAFFSGNEVYWKTRWEDNYSTLVCYKEGKDGEIVCNQKCDPLEKVWTGLWRSGCEYPLADGCRPENALSGQMSWAEASAAIEVPDTYKKLRFWRNTSIATLGTGQKATLADNTIGFEFDSEQSLQTYPNGRITMSNTNVDGKIHKLSLYRHSSGALVFGAGTVRWSWGLDVNHALGNLTTPPSSSVDIRMQQATVNLFADMGIQPGSLQTDLIVAEASMDKQAPTSVITFPAQNASLVSGITTTISGTASDLGGVVAGVQVSVDGGITWQVANGSTNWSYDWTPDGAGSVTIKTRAFDDIGNIEVLNTTSNIKLLNIITQVCPCSVFKVADAPEMSQNDNTGIEVGLKFKSTKDGTIDGILYFKTNGIAGTRSGHLWNNSGTLLAEATFVNESSSGWQQILFSTPVSVISGATYVASVYSSSGDYVLTRPFFTNSIRNGYLTALADGGDGPNGVYKYSNSTAFPTDTYQSSNYWVDVIFNTSSTVSPIVITTQPTSTSTCVGSNVSFSAAATGTPSPTAQWQSSIDGTNWVNISGATTGTLSFVPVAIDNGKQYRVIFTNSAGSVNSSTATLNINQVVASVTKKTDASCGQNNGSFIVSASAGSSPFSFSINGGTQQSDSTFKNLSSGLYDIVVTDSKGCTTKISAVTINSVSSLATTLTKTVTASCKGNDGSISVNATGGLTPYSFSLNGGVSQGTSTFSNLVPGTYSITVQDSKGCSSTIAGIIIIQDAKVSGTSSTTSASCSNNDGIITVNAIGGVQPYQYSLNSGASQSNNIFINLKAGIYSVAITDTKSCVYTLTGILLSQFSSLAASVSKTDETCLGLDGSISINATGGTLPYTYSLKGGTFQSSNTFTKLSAGTFDITVKDSKGCTAAVQAITISKVSNIVVSLSSKTNATCGGAGGLIIVSATGGTLPYSYSINGTTFQSNNTFSNLTAGVYTVTVKDSKGCSSFLNALGISQTSNIVATLSSKTDETCRGNDGSISILASGGITPYQYSINGGTYQSSSTFSNLSDGNYIVTVIDAKGCSATTTAIVIAPGNTIKSTLVSETNETCSGNDGTIKVSSTGGTGQYYYTLDSSSFQTTSTFTGLSAGTYNVTVVDTKYCVTVVNGITIQQLNTVAASVTNKTNPSCKNNDGSISVTASGGVAPYQYSLNSGAYQSGNTFINLSGGTYKVIARDSKGCTATISSISISTTNTLIATVGSKTNVSCKGKDGSITLTVSGGSTPYTFSLNGGSFATYTNNVISNLYAGTYSIVAKDAKGCTSTISGIVVTNAAKLSVSVVSKTNACKNINNGIISLDGSGGIEPYQFSLNNGTYTSGSTFDDLAPSTYSVTIKDAKGCTAVLSGIYIYRTNQYCNSTLKAAIDNVALGAANTESIADVKDNICNLKVNLTTKNPLCFNTLTGSIISEVSGNTGQLLYTWSNGSIGNNLNNVGEGEYSLKITDKETGCTINSATVRLTNPSKMVAIISSDLTNGYNIKCKEGKTGNISLNVKGGTGNYTYTWSNGATTNELEGVPAGEYKVTIKDEAMCPIQTRIMLLEPSSKLEILPIVKNVDCNTPKGSIELNATGGIAPYAFSWNNGESSKNISNLVAAKYFVTIKDAAGCEVSKDFDIKDNKLSVQLMLDNKSINSAAKDTLIKLIANVTGGSGDYKYRWLPADKIVWSNTNTISSSLTNIKEYSVIVKDVAGCSSSATINIDDELINAKEENTNPATTKLLGPEVKVSPNPSTGYFKVALNGLDFGKAEIVVLNEKGKEVARRSIIVSSVHQVVTFSLLHLPGGLYFINVISDKGNLKEKLIIK